MLASGISRRPSVRQNLRRSYQEDSTFCGLPPQKMRGALAHASRDQAQTTRARKRARRENGSIKNVARAASNLQRVATVEASIQVVHPAQQAKRPGGSTDLLPALLPFVEGREVGRGMCLTSLFRGAPP